MLVTITSPGPGDGKSFLAANLALTFAEGGHRTLLVDADIRRGVLHRRLTARRRPGLTDCLRGEVPFEAILQQTAYPLLTLVGCGTRVHNAPELLSSEAMAQLVTRVRPDYEDRKSTRLNSSHGYISYAVFCLKKKKIDTLPRVHP